MEKCCSLLCGFVQELDYSLNKNSYLFILFYVADKINSIELYTRRLLLINIYINS